MELALLEVRHDMAAFDGQGRRLLGVGGVVLVHLLFVGVILSGLPKLMPTPRAMREMFLLLTPKPQPREKPLPRDRAAARPAARSVRYPAAKLPSAAPGARTLSIPLFACAPQNLADLSPEDQAKCARTGIAPPDAAAVVALRSHVRDPARHAAELAARRTPARVDCTHMETQVVQNVVQQDSLIVDPLCAAGALLRAARR